jgi:hypothetical protein
MLGNYLRILLKGIEKQLKTRHMGGFLSQFMIRPRNKSRKISIIETRSFSTKKNVYCNDNL